MTAGNCLDDEPTLFSAVLRPHRSLNVGGFVCLMLVFAAVSTLASLVFFILGAWPVMGFFGLDLVLLYWAFHVNYRDGRAYETVTVTPAELKLRQVSPRGTVREWSLNPLWVRLDRETMEDYGMQKLFVVSHGRRVSIADVLGPHEKASFADALGRALAAARRGPLRMVE